MNQKTPYEMVREFHQVFAPAKNTKPTAFTSEEALYRANFTTEEIIEFLYATSGGDMSQFDTLLAQWQEGIQDAVTKIKTKAEPVEDILVGQVDALTDTNYFVYGSFVLMGVNPDPLFQIVHQANMGKLFPDGKPHYREGDGKVIKPDNWEADYAPEPKLHAEVARQIENS
ncbi:pyrophosphohydrolase domain-containing protein [Isobaculum melis]|uniref:Energy-coupling factor transport system permease protein n=1 Tax=Isobaculum melis TaxID=142588 RepID=A0A1H9RKN0_9LACT|nr:HAD family hydrolase [Isobaculum melis]SER73095.1 energy-coupling factor transport system permease protein [Isobaculum melis]